MDYQLVIEKMKNLNKVLININDFEEINYYREIGITNFLFALHNYSIGYKSFKLEDIPTFGYLLINRILDNKDITYIKKHKKEILKYRGIIYEDPAILNIFKDDNIELIVFQNHFCTNYKTIDFFINHQATSAVISNELTKEEILSIISKVKSQVVLTIFAKNQIMYSRRLLLSNFNNHFNIKSEDDIVIKESISDSHFKIVESKYGTVLFNNEYFNYIDLVNQIDDSLIKFYLVLNLDLTKETIKEVLNGKRIGNDGFLYNKSIYKIDEIKGS